LSTGGELAGLKMIYLCAARDIGTGDSMVIDDDSR
jgi:hypothetical protein